MDNYDVFDIAALYMCGDEEGSTVGVLAKHFIYITMRDEELELHELLTDEILKYAKLNHMEPVEASDYIKGQALHREMPHLTPNEIQKRIEHEH